MATAYNPAYKHILVRNRIKTQKTRLIFKMCPIELTDQRIIKKRCEDDILLHMGSVISLANYKN